MSNITQLSKLRNETWKNSKKKGGRKQREKPDHADVRA
jgi:hypothetical protein